MKKVLSIMSTALIVVLLILLCAVLASKLIFGVEMKAVLTPSMEPELPVGSLLIIAPVDYEDIDIGDDITFVRDSNLTLVTHRVIEKNDSEMMITTQGIANNVADSPIEYENVVGKVRFHILYLGYLIIWTSTIEGKIIAAAVIIAFIIISFLFDKNSEKEEESNENDESEDSQL